jgi:hypothetical protein
LAIIDQCRGQLAWAKTIMWYPIPLPQENALIKKVSSMGKCCVWVNSRKIREIKMRNLGPPESQSLLLDRIISIISELA